MASTSANGSYHAPAIPGKSLQAEYADVKARYWQMEESYHKKLDQEKQRPDIVLVREKLLATRSTCVELANERNTLLDRILQLELSAGQANQLPISGPLGTERESRFRDRITSALKQRADLNSDPYTNSTHCGPAAIQEYQQKYANTSVHGDTKSMGPEFDSVVGKGSPSKRPAGRGTKMTTDESPSAPSIVPSAPASFAASATTPHPPESAPQQPTPASAATRPIPKIRVKPIAPHPAMGAPAPVPPSHSLSNLLDGNSTYRDSTTPSEAAPVAPEGHASS